jgi:hypothetical protein
VHDIAISHLCGAGYGERRTPSGGLLRDPRALPSDVEESAVTVPIECRPLAGEIAGLEAERSRLQEELRRAPPQEKAQLVVEIRQLNRSIAEKNDEFLGCIADAPPVPLPLAAQLVGTAAITITNPSVPATPFSAPAVWDLLFDGSRTRVTVASFPPIVSPPFSTPLGANTTTISLQSGGSGAHTAGALTVSLTLLFNHSIDVIFLEEDSTLPMLLSTAAPGSPIDGTGAVSLVGGGMFQGGFLNGSPASLRVDGVISPRP